MADEGLLDLLHSEIVSQVFSTAEKNEKENCISKLEYIGFTTGYRLVERLTKEWPRFKDELDMVKFICKDFWAAIYKKQIDGLRTNNRGVYVLEDKQFRFLMPLSASHQYLELTSKYVAFTCGMIRGALANLGITVVVTSEVTSPPSCKFQIQAQQHPT